MRADLRRLSYIFVCRLINRFSMSSAMSSTRIYHVIANELLYNYVCLSVHLFSSSSLSIYISIFFILFFIFLRDLMDPVIIVYGNWIKKNIYVFNADSRECRVLHLNEKTKHEEFAKSVLDDYRLNELRTTDWIRNNRYVFNEQHSTSLRRTRMTKWIGMIEQERRWKELGFNVLYYGWVLGFNVLHYDWVI